MKWGLNGNKKEEGSSEVVIGKERVWDEEGRRKEE
jgi:hypothetical protein